MGWSRRHRRDRPYPRPAELVHLKALRHLNIAIDIAFIKLKAVSWTHKRTALGLKVSCQSIVVTNS